MAIDIAISTQAGWFSQAAADREMQEIADNVTELTIGVEGASSAGMLYIDDIRLHPNAVEYITPTEPDAAALVARYALDGNTNDPSGNGHNGTAIGAPTYVAGTDG